MSRSAANLSRSQTSPLAPAGDASAGRHGHQRRAHALGRFLPFLRPYRGRLALALLAAMARPGLNAAKVWLLKVLIDDVIRARQPGLLLAVSLGYVGLAAAKGIVTYTDDVMSGTVGSRVVRDLRVALYDRLQGLSLGAFHRHRLGDLLTRLSGDTAAVEDLLVHGLSDLLRQCLTVVVFLGMLVWLDARLALLASSVLPLVALVAAAHARAARAAQVAVRERSSELTSTAEEGISAIALVKAFAREPFEYRRFASAAGASAEARMRSLKLRALFLPLTDVVATRGPAAGRRGPAGADAVPGQRAREPALRPPGRH